MVDHNKASPWPEGSHEQDSVTVLKYPLEYQLNHRKGLTEGHLAKDESMRLGLEDVSAKENKEKWGDSSSMPFKVLTTSGWRCHSPDGGF